MPNALVVLYLAGGQDGLNVIVPNSSHRLPARTPDAADDRADPGPERERARRLAADPDDRRRARVRRPDRLERRRRRQRRRDSTASTRSTATATAARARTSRCCRRPTTPRPTSRTSPARTTGSRGAGLAAAPAGSGRWLDLYGSSTNPLQGISIGYSLSKYAAERAGARLHDLRRFDARLRAERRAAARRAATTSAVDPNAVLAQLASASPGNAQRAPAARSAYGWPSTVEQQTQRARQRHVWQRLPAELRPGPSCSSPRSCSRPASEPASSRSTGAASTPTATRSRPRIRSWSSCRTASAPSRPTSPARGIDGQVATLMFSEFGRRVQDNASAGPTTARAD